MSIARQTKILANQVTFHTSNTTGAVALSKSEATPQTGKQWKLIEVRLSVDAVGESGSLTVTINDSTNAVYDHILLTQDMTSAQYVRFLPSDVILKSGDTIDIAWANANTHTYGLTVVKQLIY